MIHYHVWFNLKTGVQEENGLPTVKRFLANLCAEDEANTFKLLRNNGEVPRSKLPRYHALIEFADQAQLGAAMKRQRERGIHAGLHGEIIDIVTDFHVEIFTHITDIGCPSD